MFSESPLFIRHALDATCNFFVGSLPSELNFSTEQFKAFWATHPGEFNEIWMPGGLVKTPRWTQAYGADYQFTGRTYGALPVTPTLQPLLRWSRDNIDERLNGLLVNWYDGQLRHHIGKHRDSTVDMIEGAPIVTMSFGEERVFRLRPWRGQGMRDLAAPHGAVFVIPYETNLRWTHEVPRFAKNTGRRISITLRGFENGFQKT